MSITDADRLAAEGVPVVLADGRTVHLRYTFRSLRRLEKLYGSLAGVNTAMRLDDKGRATGQYFGPILEMLHAGLLHEGIGEEDLEVLAVPGRVAEYDQAIQDALEQAFTPPDGSRADPTKGSGNSSPGQTSTGRQPSDSDSVTSSSGTR